MIYQLAIILGVVLTVINIPLAGVVVSVAGFRRSRRIGKIVWAIVGGILSVPVLSATLSLGCLVVLNAPFTSGVIAYTSTPEGDEACVVQSSAIFEYRVSLYARHRGEPWNWNYLGHDDDRWRDCRVEFAGDELRVYRNGAIQKSLSIATAMDARKSDYQMPANYTPAEICAEHNAKTF